MIPHRQAEDMMASLPLFRDLAPEALQRLATSAQLAHVQRDEIIFHTNAASDGFYIVVHGQVKLAFTSESGDEKVIRLIGRGGHFGEGAMFMEEPHFVYAQALADGLLLFLPKAAAFAEVDRDAGFARQLLASVSLRLHDFVNDVEAYSLQSGMQRLIGYLLRYESGVVDAGGHVEVHLPANKGTVASRLNITPETLSRFLHELAGKGLISVEGRIVQILDEEKLRQYAG
jgi:CRP/FNR family transcriptional regulator, dissimilatory nitrate respiration regulator